MEHNNNIYDFVGTFVWEISEISPNTLSKVTPKTTFVEKTGRFSPIYDILLVEYIDLITLGGGLLENKHVPYEGLVVIEASNAQHGMFSFKTQPLYPKRKYFEAIIYQNTNIYMDFSEFLLKTLTLMQQHEFAKYF